jgi:hypothetical protein
MGDFRKLGYEPPRGLEEPVAEAMTEIPAGNLVVGVEDRNLLHNYGMPFGGPTVHIFGAEDGKEYLRFDLFETAPHYHYVLPDGSHRVIVYDAGALGDMVEWTMQCLETRVPDMLRQCKAEVLAAGVDNDALQKIVPRVRELTFANYRPVVSTLADRAQLTSDVR